MTPTEGEKVQSMVFEYSYTRREIERNEPQEAKLWWDWARNLVF